jgi:hypothetical protein
MTQSLAPGIFLSTKIYLQQVESYYTNSNVIKKYGISLI